MSRRQSHRAPVTADHLTEDLQGLWALHRYLHGHRTHPNLTAQYYRTRAAVMAAIAETMALQDALHTPDPIDMDRALTDSTMSGDHL